MLPRLLSVLLLSLIWPAATRFAGDSGYEKYLLAKETSRYIKARDKAQVRRRMNAPGTGWTTTGVSVAG